MWQLQMTRHHVAHFFDCDQTSNIIGKPFGSDRGKASLWAVEAEIEGF